MRKAKSYYLILIIVVGVALNFSITESNTLAYIEHGSFLIYSDYYLEYYGFPGTGTADDPYIIEYYNITDTSWRAIYIRSITKHLIIRNCIINAYHTGLSIENNIAGSILLQNNTFNCHYNGIRMDQTADVIIQNNVFEYTYDPISILNSQNILIDGNYMVNLYTSGIGVGGSNNV
ncbi:MAG: right-handed parallel beta-helix repeat-containing protein, partial [Asgard group archaeon]|nr:right-handed parallel beta-helix repeat-containing protein [Asgard group archaeon]